MTEHEEGRRVRQSRAIACAVLAAIVLTVATSTRADIVTAVNDARRFDCGDPQLAPLREDRSLDAAASALARGTSLHRALAELPERPASATSLRVSGRAGDRAIESLLATRYCRELTGPGLRTLGIARRGADLWLVLAAPLAVPASTDRTAVADEVLARVNAARQSPRRCGGRPFDAVAPVQLSATLSTVATHHAADMAARDDLQHEDPDGSTPADRVRRSGYGARLVGENIASGVPSADEVVRGWLSSPGHCANIMDGRFTEMGVGYVVAPRASGAIYWAQLLAQPR